MVKSLSDNCTRKPHYRIDEIIENKKNGLFIQPRNPVDMVSKIIRISSDDKLRTKLIKGGKISIKRKFSLGKAGRYFGENLSRLK